MSMSYFNKWIRRGSKDLNTNPVEARSYRSRSLDVEALERSGIRTIRYVCFLKLITKKNMLKT